MDVKEGKNVFCVCLTSLDLDLLHLKFKIDTLSLFTIPLSGSSALSSELGLRTS